jgi:signal transduction histidine kinase
VGLFSLATYVPYRAAALRAFDLDLRDNLDTLQNALGEELREAHAKASNPAASDPAELMRIAASEALGEFRLTRLYAELRSGPAAGTRVAALAREGTEPAQSLLSAEQWARVADFPPGEAHVVILPDGMRGVARTFEPPGSASRVSLLVADRTRLVDQTLASMRRALLEYGIAGLALALAGGYWVARRALRPIEVFTAQASAMAAAPSTPGARLDLPNREDELGRLGASFNLLLERIEQSLNRTRAFIADAAHELKTPVAIVRTEAELSLSRVRSLEESREALGAIAAESARLSRLVSDLTLLAEGETLEVPLERRLVDLTELVHEVVRSLRALAMSRNATVEVEAPPGLEFRGDERLLRQILVNLVENAIKFSRPPARIGIAVDQEDGRVEVRVLDEAATLSADERERVFERFYRARRSDEGGTSGSGLGLAIVRWAVGLHGGSIRIEPRGPASGNAFIAEFPLNPTPPPPEAGVS